MERRAQNGSPLVPTTMHHATINLSFVLALACVPASRAATEPLSEALPRITRQSPLQTDFLYAIRMVESGDVYNCRPGKLGEQGPYQFRREVWNQYTQAPFAQARTAFADQVAQEHYQWIVKRLRSHGLAPTAWRVAAAWNGGVESVVSGRVPRAARSYATRVVNLVQDQAAIRAALTPRYRIEVASVP
jgi:hypothetical protein